MDTRDRVLKTIDEVFSINEHAKIIAVTKNTPPEIVNIAISEGISTLGENRVQEFLDKHSFYNSKDVHFIGHLQSNKVKFLIDKVQMIQSVDSLKLCKVIDELSAKNDKITDILVQINIGKEQSKSGIFIEETDEIIEKMSEFSNVNIRGFMCIPPKCDELSLERFFDKMHEKFTQYEKFDTLSMGMSNDFALALKHGSNMVRIGSKIFKK